jgi:hypothetical protein
VADLHARFRFANRARRAAIGKAMNPRRFRPPGAPIRVDPGEALLYGSALRGLAVSLGLDAVRKKPNIARRARALDQSAGQTLSGAPNAEFLVFADVIALANGSFSRASGHVLAE